jgi:phosphoenolpyruvate carboxykinase (ATP)
MKQEARTSPWPSRNGDRGAREVLRKQFVAQRPNHRQPEASPTCTRAHSRPGTPGHRQSPSGMPSLLPIGRAAARGPTSLYPRPPRPRVRQESRRFVISTSLHPSPAPPVSPGSPSRKWISRIPTLPSWCLLPRPLSTHAPKPPDLERRRKHLRSMKDPVARSDSPSTTNPSTKGPRSQLSLPLKRPSAAATSKPSQTQTQATCHLDDPLPLLISFTRTVLPNTVNKTGLHPSGIMSVPHHRKHARTLGSSNRKPCSPHREHTELGMHRRSTYRCPTSRVSVV